VGAAQSGEKRAPRSIPEAERFYFFEEWYPKYGNLVPRDMLHERFTGLCIRKNSESTGRRRFTWM